MAEDGEDGEDGEVVPADVGVTAEEVREGFGDAVAVTVTVTVAGGVGLLVAAPHAETASAVANAVPVITRAGLPAGRNFISTTDDRARWRPRNYLCPFFFL